MSHHRQIHRRNLSRSQSRPQSLNPSQSHFLRLIPCQTQSHCLILIRTHSPFPNLFRSLFLNQFRSRHCFRIGFDSPRM